MRPRTPTSVLFLALAVCAIGPVRAPASELTLGVLEPDSGPRLEAVAPGFRLWATLQLGALGFDASPVDGPVEAALARAHEAGLSHAVLPRLRLHDGTATVQLLVLAPGTETILLASRIEAPLADLGTSAGEALDGIASQLGALAPAVAPTLEELACVTRALERRAAGDLYGAFREVQGKLSSTAMALRESLLEEARIPGAPAAQRARLLAAAGDPDAAWGLIASATRAARSATDPDVETLIAAGEIELARDDAASARRDLEAALTHASGRLAADAQLGLARVLERQGDLDAARAALRRAAELVPADVAPHEALARLTGEPEIAGAHLIAAGDRAALRLDPGRARGHFRRASELSPVLSPESARSTARLEAEIGRPAQALSAWQQTAAAGADDADLHLGVARAARALGRSEPSRLAYRKALERRAEFAPALVELGALEIESGDAERGLQLLGSARKLESDLDTRRHLARALEKGGDPESAHAVLAELPESEQTGADLTRMASLQAARGDRKAARATLERAVHRDPYDPSLRAERARLLESLGDASAAAEREIATLLTGSRAQPGAETRFQPSALTLDELVNTFAVQVPGAQRRTVSPLGVREPGDWRTWLDRISRPKSPDLPAIGQALEAAIDARFIGVAAPPLDDPALRSHVDPLFDFGNEASRSAQSIATINGVLGTDGVVVAMLRTVPEDPENPLCAEGDFEMHMRLLMGREPEIATILSNVECVADGAEVFGTWNWIAGVAYGLLGLILAMPVLRGWGTLHVSIQLPNHTKGFFSIHITTRPDQVRRDRVDKKTGREKTQSIRRIPDVFRRYERHMAGRETPFRWTPARKSGYIVTVAGPLLDAQGKEIIGHFFEEQKVRVRRGAVTKVTFDFRPKECAVEMKVLAGGRPAAGGKVAVRGDSTSLRYTRDGVAYLYLGLGSYTLVVGSHDAATEIPLEVHSLESSIPMSVDLEDAHTAFSGCADAVEPYLQGDLATAADVLEAHGDATAAHRIRALHLRALGRDEEAAVELEAAGEIEGAAELRADGADFAGSADLYEQAGDFQNAADAYRAAGDYAEAARCFERIYDYENAIECWREIGDSEREMLLLEKIGEFMDAGRIAHELGDVERAIGNLQKIDRRHREYAEACRLIGAMLSQRGDHELGVAKFEEALDACGPESATIEMLEGHAAALEAAGRKRESLAAWEAVARRDARRSGAATRIEALRREVGETETTGAQAAASEPVESRYERLEEIGRGGMGVVYKARDRRLGRVVALKELPDNLKEHPNAVALFEREARAAAALNHGNIVTLFDAGEENGSYFITMELLEGKPLNAILERHGSLSTRDVARLGTQIASGLHYAHEQRIVHRDIKASNLFFTKDHTVKIMDFGIAKSLEEVRRSTTVVGGTPYYMAPEQAAGEAVDHRADLYAFGVTLFQLATGTVPFADGDVTYRHRHEAPPDPRELDASIPERLARLVLALMEKRVEDRPESAAVAWNELRAILAEQVDA